MYVCMYAYIYIYIYTYVHKVNTNYQASTWKRKKVSTATSGTPPP